MGMGLLSLFLLFSLSVVEASTSSHHRQDTQGGSNSSRQSYPFRPTKVFVFGDSYADTGNIRKSLANSWKLPYGTTFPGKPAGRFSDGRVFTDFFAKYYGVKSPLPYQWRKLGANYLKHGMNFAFGGTGVFDTLVGAPNMTTQINLLENMISSSSSSSSSSSIYSTVDLQSAVALLTLSGNDYSFYLSTGGSSQGLPGFISGVVSQLGVNLERIHALGIKKVVVAALPPLGCLPSFTATSNFQKCNDTINSLVVLHNNLLHQAVAQLNNRTVSVSSNFIVADLYTSFMSVLTSTNTDMKPCCVGISSDYYCGSVAVNGTPKYTVCDDPKSSFFWDMSHPTQEGWRAVAFSLSPTLSQLQLH